jgi:hypothetical protein
MPAKQLTAVSLFAGVGGVVFCNPPYGREIGKWTRKAVEQAAQGKTIVLLIPSRTDTKWWHEDVMTADEISKKETP